jgi:1-acyl-sn-glycerol-3-phosphate acyltransferase
MSPPWLSPVLRPRIMRMLRHPRVALYERRLMHLSGIEVHGLEHLREPLKAGCGILITPKHAGHADAYVLLTAAERLGLPFCYMVAWQVFELLGPLGSRVLRWHGCFSVNREGTDFLAYRQAVDILQNCPNPLVIFAEGEVYHNCDWVAPFRTGAAAQRAERAIVCVPAVVRYRYVRDPTPQLLPVMDALEEKLLARRQTGLPLADRVYDFAQAVLEHWERVYLDQRQTGQFTDRIVRLCDLILKRLEDQQGQPPADADIPGRVTLLRRHVVGRLESLRDRPEERRQCRQDLTDLDIVLQLFSYCRDYPQGTPSMERVAEMVDKFEEDVLGEPSARVRGVRQGLIRFGPAIPVEKGRGRNDVRLLTDELQRRVESLLAQMRGSIVAEGLDRIEA